MSAMQEMDKEFSIFCRHDQETLQFFHGLKIIIRGTYHFRVAVCEGVTSEKFAIQIFPRSFFPQKNRAGRIFEIFQIAAGNHVKI
jgi:hypothetical protein